MKDRKKLSEEIISGILAGTIIISPVINISNFSKNRNNKSNKETSSMVGTTNPTLITNEEVNKASDYFIEEVNDILGNDYLSITIPSYLENIEPCIENYEYDRMNSNDVYNLTNYLLEQIKINSTNYIKDHQSFILGFLNSVEDNNRSDKIATQTILKNTIYDVLQTGTNKDICLIKELKYVISYDNTLVNKETYVTYIEEDNLLIIFPDNIREYDTSNFWNILEYAIQCEINTIRQYPCKCQKDTISFPYATIKKASAKSELYTYNKVERLVNNFETRSESLILTLGLFTNNVSINDYYNAIFNNDIERLYEFCGVNDNEEEIYKLNNILYKMDITSGNNNILDDQNLTNYKVELFGMIINNMIRYTENNKDFKLKDNLILFNVIKNLIITDIETVNNDDILEDIFALNNIYIEYLSIHYDVSIDIIKNDEISDDIVNSVLGVIENCNRNDDISIDYEYISYSHNLVKRFPLLKNILCFATFNPLDYYDISNNSHNYTLIKKR